MSMETFEIIVKDKSYKVIRDSDDSALFSVFNHATFYVIKKNEHCYWEKVEHRFGWDNLPISDVGRQIDLYYDYIAYGGMLHHPDFLD